jgi:hypothetical protein
VKSLLFALSAFATVAFAEPDTQQKGAEHLAALTAEPWLAGWKTAKLEDVRLVSQKPNLTWPTGLAPAWWAKIVNADGSIGHLSWDSRGEGALMEFAFDAALDVRTENARAIAGVPAIQQFAMPVNKGNRLVASGCVPTSGASVLAFWTANGLEKWRGDAADDVHRALTRRLRSRLQMQTIADRDGFTDGAMALAGAMPADLASAIQDDADQLGVPVKCEFQRFAFEKLVTELNAGRPVLLSCTVAVPQKPELSWGHAVVGAGWARIQGKAYVGIVDNFFPTKNPATIRWVRDSVFDSLTVVRPKTAEKRER